MSQGGFQLVSPVTVDNALSVAGSGTTFGASIDLGPNTSPQPIKLDAEWAITGDAVDGYDVEIGLQWSADGSTWPSNTEYSVVTAKADATGGASLNTDVYTLPEPKRRYCRFVYVNNNASTITITSKVAQQLLQAAS